jgi:hypothetical protein
LPAGIREIIPGTIAPGGAAGAAGARLLPFNSGPGAGCSALTRCTGCQELAMIIGLLVGDWAAGTGWSLIGLEAGADEDDGT